MLCFKDTHLSTGHKDKSSFALMIPLWMNSEVGSDKEELKKPFHVLHEKDFEDEDRAFFA